MLMKPLVSVVIPVFNGGQFLERTLQSAQRQTYGDLEIIVVNDGSTDNSLELAKRHASSDPRLKVVAQNNRGVAAARNCGLEHASGEYVAFLDADDIWHPTKIERQIELLLAATGGKGDGSVYALQRNIDAHDRVLSSGRFWSRAGSFLDHFIGLLTDCGSGILTRRDLAIAVGGYDSTYRTLNAGGAEDLDFELKLIARFPMFVVPEYLVGYRVTHESMSRDTARMERALRAVIARHIKAGCVSRRNQRLIRGEFYMFLFGNHLGKRDVRGTLKALNALGWNDQTLGAILKLLPRKILRTFRKCFGHQSSGPKFYDISPLESA
jgi:glycosyltransferase involved in cell wall biosynthesis